MKKLLFSLALAMTSAGAFSQNGGFKEISLNNLDAFQPNAGNWFVVGKVFMDRSRDIHENDHAVTPQEPTGKKRRQKKNQPTPPTPASDPVTFENGTGILLNMNTKEKRSNLVTNFEHGDIELELELMIPKGSNSGIYLQGGYEVQLLDSWGVSNPKFGDIGGIYRNWETNSVNIYSGKAPLVNAARAPGLWQTLKISFKAPRFNAQGEKTANAKFISVELNGIRIHDNLEVPQLIGGPLDKKEKAMGPLMIQGDHGPVAFRNIRYRLLKESQVTLSPLSYKVYESNFVLPINFNNLTSIKEGTVPEINWEVAGKEDSFGIIYNGVINIPESDEYNFEVNHAGLAVLTVDGNEFLEKDIVDYQKSAGKIRLEKGEHSFQLGYTKNAVWMSGRLGLTVSSPSTYPKILHHPNSFPLGANLIGQITVSPGSETKLLRAFLDYNGDLTRRLTHTIAVGEPSGIHYIYDLKAGSPVCVWRGEFINATPMWHERGDGSFVPMGMVQYLFTGPAIAELADSTVAFPASYNETDFRGNGYTVKGRPEFHYNYKGTEVSDKLYPEDENRILTRELSFKNFSGGQLYLRIAEGAKIEKLRDGSFAIDDKKYYINLISGTPLIRTQGGKEEMLMRVDGTPVKYSIIW